MIRSKLSVLVISYSRIASDARVLRQIRELQSRHAVTVAGHGPLVLSGVEFVPLPAPSQRPLQSRALKLLLVLRLFRLYEAVGQVERHPLSRALRGRTFDVVVSNDLEPLPFATKKVGADHVVLDAHEFAPMQSLSLRWRVIHGAYQRWLCRRYLPVIRSVSTVSAGIAAEYERRFRPTQGVMVIPNAPDFVEMKPSPTKANRIDLVYHGIAGPDRGIDVLIEAMRELDDRFRLNLILMDPETNSYVDTLRKQARGLSAVRFLDPLPATEIARGINRFDIGLFIYPPLTPNHAFSLPNKLYEYVQGRLAIVTGPSPEMAALVREFGLGLVTEGFESQQLARTLRSIDENRIRQFKEASNIAASKLSWDAVSNRLQDLIDRVQVTRIDA
jgi:glycosyltransferase involved in cell wall biosynthesis